MRDRRELEELKRIERTDERILEVEERIAGFLKPKLSFIKIAFRRINMSVVQGPVTLNPGQSSNATVLYFDTNGNPMPSSFVPPPVTYAIDNSAIASSAPQADGQTDLVTYVAAGVANLTATVQGPNGVLTDTETVTCTAAQAILGAIKIGFSTPTP